MGVRVDERKNLVAIVEDGGLVRKPGEDVCSCALEAPNAMASCNAQLVHSLVCLVRWRVRERERERAGAGENSGA